MDESFIFNPYEEINDIIKNICLNNGFKDVLSIKAWGRSWDNQILL